MRLKKEFFLLRAPELAPALIGKLLCRKIPETERTDGGIGDQIIKLRITETECYFGEEDTACHASHGKTNRNQVMYLEGGVAYVYLCYGIHSLINVVSGPKDFPEAVLLRGVEGFDGPGKLTKAMNIDQSFNGESFITSSRIWIEDDGTSLNYSKSKRIGIDYATEQYRNILWRFIATLK